MNSRLFKPSAGAAAVIVAGALSGAGLLGSAQAHPSGDGVAHAAKRHRTHHRHHVARHTKIPQHNGGDRDADNRGGPNDGDGNL